ncbi:MAG: hypothetical protein HC896_07360 [Bacteroidales bacterium]|nr:hypothetical protein [Bacteroidales bacterium]
MLSIDINNKHLEVFEDLNLQAETDGHARWFLSKKGEVVQHNLLNGQWLLYNASDGLIDSPVRLISTATGQIIVSGSHNQEAAVAMLKNGKWTKKVFPRCCIYFDYRSLIELSDGTVLVGASNAAYHWKNPGLGYIGTCLLKAA